MRGKQTTASETKLITRCMEGDHHSFRELYDIHKEGAFSTAVRMLGNIHDAEDALQDTFIKIFRNINHFRGESSFTTWIYRITVNTCIEHLRKRKKVIDMDSRNEDLLLSAGHKPAGDFKLIVENEIEKLPEGYKTVFILHAIEGFKHREIAEIMDISPGTSKSQFFQAKSMLRKRLLPYLEVLRYEL